MTEKRDGQSTPLARPPGSQTGEVRPMGRPRQIERFVGVRVGRSSAPGERGRRLMSKEGFLKFLLAARDDQAMLARYDQRNLSQLLFHARSEGFDFSADDVADVA